MSLGTIKVDTLEHSSAGSVDTKYMINSSAKAWVYYDNLSSNVTRGSFLISSVVDNGTGDATITLSNAITTVRLEQITHSGSNADQDCNHMCIIGDLA